MEIELIESIINKNHRLRSLVQQLREWLNGVDRIDRSERRSTIISQMRSDISMLHGQIREGLVLIGSMIDDVSRLVAIIGGSNYIVRINLNQLRLAFKSMFDYASDSITTIDQLLVRCSKKELDYVYKSELSPWCYWSLIDTVMKTMGNEEWSDNINRFRGIDIQSSLDIIDDEMYQLEMLLTGMN